MGRKWSTNLQLVLQLQQQIQLVTYQSLQAHWLQTLKCCSGNGSIPTALATGRTIGMTGDVVWTSASFDGSGNRNRYCSPYRSNTISSTELVSASTLLIKDSSGSTLQDRDRRRIISRINIRRNISVISNNNKQIQSTQRRTVQRKFW